MLRIPPLRSFCHLSSVVIPFLQSSPVVGFVHAGRSFSTPPARAKARASTQLPARPKPPPEEEIEEFFLKGSGPGGQKINKTSSAVQLRHMPTGVVVKSQATRSRTDNRRIARNLLALKLDELKNGVNSRVAVVGAFKKKKADSSSKKSKRKYKKLAEQKEMEEKDALSDEPQEPPEPPEEKT